MHAARTRARTPPALTATILRRLPSGIVSALWGVFVFGEIRGTRNYVMLTGSILLSVTGCVMIAASK